MRKPKPSSVSTCNKYVCQLEVGDVTAFQTKRFVIEKQENMADLTAMVIAVAGMRSRLLLLYQYEFAIFLMASLLQCAAGNTEGCNGHRYERVSRK